VNVGYVDMIGGAAGDMLLGAWLDAGVDRAMLESALRAVVAGGWELVVERVVRHGIAANHAEFVIPEERARRLTDVLDVIERSGLTQPQIQRAGAIYRRLAEAEAHVHGTNVDDVHFHEVGQLDAILDVAATCIALDLLGIEQLHCSSFPTGHGAIAMAHGMYPNPGPATLQLLNGAPLRAVDVESELVTPTAAAILTTLVERPGERIDMTVERTGYGAGSRTLSIPNLVRILVGTSAPTRPASSRSGHDMIVLETNIDDMSPQYYELALERLFSAGALDVWLTPIVMKKGRPAITLSAIAPEERADDIAQTMLRETSTIGVRMRREHGVKLDRTFVLVDSPLGIVSAKRVSAGGRTRLQPEYDEIVRIARERNLPVAEVARVVTAASERELIEQ
jgi:uncharacterized protein (TIGR00299 family) protein